MNDQDRRVYELANELVGREVYYCASSFMYHVGQDLETACKLFDENYDEAIDLFCRVNYDEAFFAAVDEALGDEDFQWLEEIVESFGFWVNAITETDFDPQNENGDDFEDWYKSLDATGKLEARDALDTYIRNNCGEDFKALCWELEIDTSDYESEVYEHWIVSRWLSNRLEARGEVTGDFAGMTIWGRCTTGQSMAMDGVIENIVREVYSHELSQETACGGS